MIGLISPDNWHMPHIFCIANQKGGVAKTTTVASLGAALAAEGKRVLLVDLDPQGCLTFSLGHDPDQLQVSVHDVLLGEEEIADALLTTDDGVTLLPATIDLAGAEIECRVDAEDVLEAFPVLGIGEATEAGFQLDQYRDLFTIFLRPKQRLHDG